MEIKILKKIGFLQKLFIFTDQHARIADPLFGTLGLRL